MAKSLKVEKLPVCNKKTTEYNERLPEPSFIKPIMGKKKEERHTKNVMKRGSTWTAIYYPIDPKTGRKKMAMKGGFKTQAQAAKAQLRLQAEADANRSNLGSKQKFKDYARSFLTWRDNGLRPNSAGNYSRVLKKYTKEIDEKRMEKIDTDDIVRVYKDICSYGFSDRTVYSYMSRIKTIFNFAEREGDISMNPFGRFTMPSYDDKKHPSPSRETLTALLKASEGHSIRVPIILALTLGLRLGEVCGLRFDDFDFEKKTVYIQRQISNMYDKEHNTVYGPAPLKTKTSKRRIGVPIKTLQLVKDLMDEREDLEKSPYVLEGCKGPFYIPASLTSRFSQFVKEQGLQCRFHDLRHAYGTICMEQDVPLNVIKDAMGHKDIKTTANIYLDTTNMMDKPANALETAMEDIIQY